MRTIRKRSNASTLPCRAALPYCVRIQLTRQGSAVHAPQHVIRVGRLRGLLQTRNDISAGSAERRHVAVVVALLISIAGGLGSITTFPGRGRI
jgi:hypothetical protein